MALTALVGKRQIAGKKAAYTIKRRQIIIGRHQPRDGVVDRKNTTNSLLHRSVGRETAYWRALHGPVHREEKLVPWRSVLEPTVAFACVRVLPNTATWAEPG